MKPIDQLTDEEINREIAEFMGGSYEGDACVGFDSSSHLTDYCKNEYICGYCKPIVRHYIESLDSLVPVWERLSRDKHVSMELHTEYIQPRDVVFCVTAYLDGDPLFDHICGTGIKPSVIATLKAIRELGNEYRSF